jgi:hypothetical protein
MVERDMKKIEEIGEESMAHSVMDPIKDAIPTMSSKAMFWRPKYLSESISLEHIPFYFWLIEAQKSSLIFNPELDDASAYFSMCQAVDKLGLDARCFGLFKSLGEDTATKASIQKYNHKHYREFSLLSEDSIKDSLYDFEDNSIDLMVLNFDSSLLFNKTLMEQWQKKLSEKSVVLIQGSQMKEVKQLCRKLKESYQTFEFLHGNGLLVVCFGSQQTAKLQFLVNRTVNDAGTRVIHDTYSRLGSACHESYVNLINTQKIAELSEQVQVKDRIIDGFSSVEFALNENLKETTEVSKLLSDDNEKLKNNVDIRFNELVCLTKLLQEKELAKEGAEKTLAKSTHKIEELENSLSNKNNDSENNIINIQRLQKNNSLLERDQSQAALIISEQKKENLVLAKSVEQRFTELATLTSLMQNKDSELDDLRNTLKQYENQTSGRENKTHKSKLSIKALKGAYQDKKAAKNKLRKAVSLIENCVLFDVNWYVKEFPESINYKGGAAAHYISIGADAGGNPSEQFNTSWYLNAYPDVKEAKVNPLLHYIKFGQSEGREINSV